MQTNLDDNEKTLKNTYR